MALIRTITDRGRSLARTAVGRYAQRRAEDRVDLPHATWGLTVGADGTLARRGLRLVDLLAEFGSPLHVIDGDALAAAAADAIRPSLAGGPAADVFYSYKTNPIPAVLMALHDVGIGAEVISPYELWLALHLGVPGERIIYNGPAKGSDSIRTAIQHGAHTINANSAGDAAQITRIAEELGTRVSLGLRVSLPSMWGGQFGVSATAPNAVSDVIDAATDRPMVDVRGLHFHRGHPMRTVAEIQTYVTEVLDYVDQLRERTGWHPEVLDLGGSIACPTVAPYGEPTYRFNRAFGTDLHPPDPSTCPSVGDVAHLTGTMVAEHCSRRGLPVPRVVIEPGRALTSSSQLLLTTVLDVKDDGDICHGVLDAGINIAEPVKSEYHQLFSVSAPEGDLSRSYRLAGPICTPADVLYNNWRLPDLHPGHVLAIMDAGAYFVPFSTSFSFPRPPIAWQSGARAWLVRDGEEFADLISKDRIDASTSSDLAAAADHQGAGPTQVGQPGRSGT